MALRAFSGDEISANLAVGKSPDVEPVWHGFQPLEARIDRIPSCINAPARSPGRRLGSRAPKAAVYPGFEARIALILVWLSARRLGVDLESDALNLSSDAIFARIMETKRQPG